MHLTRECEEARKGRFVKDINACLAGDRRWEAYDDLDRASTSTINSVPLVGEEIGNTDYQTLVAD